MNKTKKVCFKNIKACTVSWVIILAIIFSTVAPVIADDVSQIQISRWAISELNEGEKYGIYPISWYYDGFLENISEDKLNLLLERTAEKLAGLDLKKNEYFKPILYTADGTRKAVLTALYNLLNQYELSKILNVKQETPIEYMQRRGILIGINKELKLEQPCTTEQAVIFATRLISDTYEVHEGGSQGFLWKVSKGKNTIYLLGSIHVGDTNLYPISKRLKDAFEESDSLIVEANLMKQEGMNEFIQESMYTDGTSLKDHISKETYEKFIKVIEEIKLPKETYEQLKPWRIANDLTLVGTTSDSKTTEAAQQAATLGIDMYFITRAALTGKPIEELEGLKYQANLFNSLSQEIQEEYLNGALDNILNPQSKEALNEVDMMKTWLEQWHKGDVDGFTKSYSSIMEGSNDEFSQMLLGKRDEDMASKLIQLLESDDEGTYLVVVGSGHLVVKDTVIDQLKKKGYTVENIK